MHSPDRGTRASTCLDAELRGVIEEASSWPETLPLTASAIGMHRVASFREQTFAPPYEEVAEVRELVATGGPVPIRIKMYVPQDLEGAETPAVVRLHGGGMVMGSPESEDRTSRALANRMRCRVFAPAYRLAPEHPFPAGPTDCEAAIRWVVGNVDDLSVDAGRIAVLGHSAGGLLAIASALRLRNAGIHLSRYIALEPTTGPDTATNSRRDFATGFLLTKDEVAACWSLYLSDCPHPLPADAAPANATTSELRGLDPFSIITSECDPLRDEGEKFADKLAAADVDVECIRIPQSIHGSVGYMGVSKVARQAFHAIVRTLERTWADSAEPGQTQKFRSR